MKDTKAKITPLFVALLAFEIILIFLVFYNSVFKNGMGLTNFIYLITIFLIGFLILVERLILRIKGINMKTVWIVESIMVTLIMIYICQSYLLILLKIIKNYC